MPLPRAKAGAVMASTATQHGGREMTMFSGIANLLHFGMKDLAGARYQGKHVAEIAAQLVRR